MKRLQDQTLYEILEVPADAPAPEIEAAYERARSLYAPGSLATYALMSSEEAALLTSRIEEAKATLLDAGARARYDDSLAHPALAGHGNGAGASALPPIIPAFSPAASPECRADGSLPCPEEPPDAVESATEAPEPEPRSPGPALLLANAVGSGGPPPGEARRPILLQREVGSMVSPPRPVASAARRAPEPPIPEVAEWTGDALRAAREARGITVQQIAERTKVTRHHVENIEAERFGALPAPVYLRGILLAVARELRLDGQRVARSYLERAAGSLQPPPPPKPR